MTIYSGNLDVAPDDQDIGTLATTRGARFSAGLAEDVEGSATANVGFGLTLAGAEGKLDQPMTQDEIQSFPEEAFIRRKFGGHPTPDVPIDQAKAQLKAAKLDSQIKLPDQPTIRQGALDLMIDHARSQAEHADAIARGPQGFIPSALDVGTSFLVGAVDPTNIAAFSIPVVGEARYGYLMERAGDSILARAGVRAGVGAAQGVVGSAIMTPFDYAAHTEEGRDYTMADMLANIVQNAAIGGLAHAGAGGLLDVYRRIRGRPLELPDGRFVTPAASLEASRRAGAAEPEGAAQAESGAARLEAPPAGDTAPSASQAARVDASGLTVAQRIAEEIRTGREPEAPSSDVIDHPPSATTGESGLDLRKAEEPGATESAPVAPGVAFPSPAEVTFANLPPRAREDTARAAVAAIIKGEPVQSAEILKAAAEIDPRIARALGVWADNAPTAEVFADVRTQLINAGMTEADSSYNAAVWAARYATRAERTGQGSAFDLYRGENVEVGNGRPLAEDAERHLLSETTAEPRQVGFRSTVQDLTSHNDDSAIKADENYKAAKAGDAEAAARLVDATVDRATLDQAKAKFGPEAIYTPVTAEEATGHNAIPHALAALYADETGAKVATEVHQVNRAFHTGAGAMERLANRARFAGDVVKGGKYVLVDDVSVMGSTIAEMADHIERNGGEVAGVVTLANASRTKLLRPTAATVRKIEGRFGNVIRELFGIDPAALTADEAQYILNFRNADALRDRVTAAQGERGRRLGAKGIRADEGRTFSQVATVNGVRVDFPDRDHEALFNMGRDLAYPGKVKPAAEQAMLDRFRGFVVEDSRHGETFNSIEDLRELARTYYDQVSEMIAQGRPVRAFDVLEEDHRENWYRRQLDEAEQRQPPAGQSVNRPPTQLSLFQSNPTAPTFYSAVSRAVEASKQSKASPSQWLAQIKNTPGVKGEEMKWLGLEDWLKEQEGSVTKEQVQDYLRANNLELKEVVHGEPEMALTDAENALLDGVKEKLKEGAKYLPKRMTGVFGEIDLSKATPRDVAHYRSEGVINAEERLAWDKLLRDGDAITPARYESYKLRGGENYREMLLTLPPNTQAAVAARAARLAEIDEQIAKIEEMRAEMRSRMMTAGQHREYQKQMTALNENAIKVAETYGLASNEYLEAWTPIQELAKTAVANDQLRREYSDTDRMLRNHQTQRRMVESENIDRAAYKSSHWDEPNILAHIRFDDRMVDGQRALHLAEIQSDWHQQGRRQGYAGPKTNIDLEPLRAAYKEAYDAASARRAALFDEITGGKYANKTEMIDAGDRQGLISYDTAIRTDPELKRLLALSDEAQRVLGEAADSNRKGTPGVPDAPFKTTWPELALKRMIRYAAENGYDRITWDTGDTSAERYDLSKQVDSLLYKKNADGTYRVSAQAQGRGHMLGESIPEDKLEDFVGKEVAKKIVDGEGKDTEVQGKYDPVAMVGSTDRMKSLSGVDLKVGGEGMKGFYDKILPAAVTKLTKKFGGKVEEARVPIEPPTKPITGPDDRAVAQHGDALNRLNARFDAVDQLLTETRWEHDNQVFNRQMPHLPDPSEAQMQALTSRMSELETERHDLQDQINATLAQMHRETEERAIAGDIDRDSVRPDAQASRDHGERFEELNRQIDELRKAKNAADSYANDLLFRHTRQIYPPDRGPPTRAEVDEAMAAHANFVEQWRQTEAAREALHSQMVDETVNRMIEAKWTAGAPTAPAHSLALTPELKDAALSEGFPLFQTGSGTPEPEGMRGRITFETNRTLIDLFKRADASTFMHESAHLWLDEMMRDAAADNATAQLVADRDALLFWLGVEDPADIGVVEHEKFATAFEQYLREGNAPSKALQGVFAQFKAWLEKIYNSLAGLGAPISDDVRGIFDRMLATDREIAERNTPDQAEAPAPVPPAAPVAPKRRTGGFVPAAQPMTLVGFLKAAGGLKDSSEFKGRDYRKQFPGLINNKRGMTIDHARQVAAEAGFLGEPIDDVMANTTPADFLDALDSHPKYRDRDADRLAKWEGQQEGRVWKERLHSEYATIETWAHENDLPDWKDKELVARAAEIRLEDPEVEIGHGLLERAAIEIYNRHSAEAEARGEPPLEPADAYRHVENAGHDIHAAQGANERAGSGAAADLPGSRPPVQTPDGAWRAIAQGRDGPDGQDIINASAAAERLPEPASLGPVEKADAALAKAAQAAQDEWAAISQFLEPEEREAIDARLAESQKDNETRLRSLRDTMSCLIVASA